MLIEKTRTALIDRGLAQHHHLLEESGWISTYLQSDQDLRRVRNLLRLSLLLKRVRRMSTMEEQLELTALIDTLGIKRAKE